MFLFLCAMFLCGAAAGGLTGLRAGEGDGAAVLSGLLAELPAHVVQSTLCALIWVLLPLVCAFLRPRELLLSAVAAARGFVLAMTVAVMYIMYFAIGVITGVTEWNKILTTKGRKIKSFFTFPLFMFTYIPISIAALFRKVEWSQIKHTVAVSINDMNAGKAQNGKDRSDAGKKVGDADGSADGNTKDTDEKEEKK